MVTLTHFTVVLHHLDCHATSLLLRGGYAQSPTLSFANSYPEKRTSEALDHTGGAGQGK